MPRPMPILAAMALVLTTLGAVASDAAAQATGFIVIAGIEGEPAAVFVDGERRGTLGGEELALEVPPGTRRVAVMRTGAPPFQTEVEVPRDGMVEIEPRFQPTGAPPAPAVADVTAEPTATPMTVRPQLRNEAEVTEALARNYPRLLRDAGIGGTARVWLYIDEQGRVRRAQLNESSGYDPMDEAALRVAATMEFTPARNDGERVPVWLVVPITFQVR